MLLRIHHALITYPEGAEDAARAFYCERLGLPEVEKPASLAGRGGFWVQVGSQQVHLGPETGVDRVATRAHLAYEVSELDSWQTRLEAQGIAVQAGIPIPGYRRFEFRDPFGNRVEMIQAEEPS